MWAAGLIMAELLLRVLIPFGEHTIDIVYLFSLSGSSFAWRIGSRSTIKNLRHLRHTNRCELASETSYRLQLRYWSFLFIIRLGCEHVCRIY